MGKKHDGRTQLGGRFTEKIRVKFNEISDKDENLTDIQVIEKIIDEAEQNSNSDEIEDLKAANDNLQQTCDTQAEELQNMINQFNSKGNTDEILQNQIIEKDEKILELEQKLQQSINVSNENARLLQAYELENTQPKPGQYIVNLGDVADELLQLTQKRLEDKLKQKITPGQILADLFVKYTVEQPCDFAYPLLINKTEIKVIMDSHKK